MSDHKNQTVKMSRPIDLLRSRIMPGMRISPGSCYTCRRTGLDLQTALERREYAISSMCGPLPAFLLRRSSSGQRSICCQHPADFTVDGVPDGSSSTSDLPSERACYGIRRPVLGTRGVIIASCEENNINLSPNFYLKSNVKSSCGTYAVEKPGAILA